MPLLAKQAPSNTCAFLLYYLSAKENMFKMVKILCITTVLICLGPCSILAEGVSNNHYTKVMSATAWWEKAKLPGASSIVASSLIMCASFCSKYTHCDTFEYLADTTCQLGKSDTPVEARVEEQGEKMEIYKEPDDSCTDYEGI